MKPGYRYKVDEVSAPNGYTRTGVKIASTAGDTDTAHYRFGINQSDIRNLSGKRVKVVYTNKKSLGRIIIKKVDAVKQNGIPIQQPDIDNSPKRFII